MKPRRSVCAARVAATRSTSLRLTVCSPPVTPVPGVDPTRSGSLAVITVNGLYHAPTVMIEAFLLSLSSEGRFTP